MHGSLPVVRSRTADTLLGVRQASDVILVAQINMRMSAHDISGYVLFIMDVPSIESFMRQVARLFNLPERV